jgi:flagellar basal body-associated protein FliL
MEKRYNPFQSRPRVSVAPKKLVYQKLVPPKPPKKRILSYLVLGAVVSLFLFVVLGSKSWFPWMPELRNWGIASKPVAKTNEITLCSDMTTMCSTGKNQYYITASIFAKAGKDQKDQLQAMVNDHNGQIKDCIRSSIASLSPQNIHDPHLKTLKTELKTSLDRIVGPDMVDSILIPEWQAEPVR